MLVYRPKYLELSVATYTFIISLDNSKVVYDDFHHYTIKFSQKYKDSKYDDFHQCTIKFLAFDNMEG